MHLELDMDAEGMDISVIAVRAFTHLINAVGLHRMQAVEDLRDKRNAAHDQWQAHQTDASERLYLLQQSIYDACHKYVLYYH